MSYPHPNSNLCLIFYNLYRSDQLLRSRSPVAEDAEADTGAEVDARRIFSLTRWLCAASGIDMPVLHFMALRFSGVMVSGLNSSAGDTPFWSRENFFLNTAPELPSASNATPSMVISTS